MKTLFPKLITIALCGVLLLNGNAYSDDVDLIAGDTLKINFQPIPGETAWPFNRWANPTENPVPEPPNGYFWCDGAAFDLRDNGFYYGFREENKRTRWRQISFGPDNPDSLLLQSFNHLQNSGTFNVWEVEIPNGWYNVMLVCGDPDYGDFISTVNINGTTVLDPTPIQQFPEGGGAVFDTLRAVVNVTNQMMTLMPDTAMALGELAAVNVKFAFLHIWKFQPTFPQDGTLKINFQPEPGETELPFNRWPNSAENPVPEPPDGYLWCDGAQYGYRDNGYFYGFLEENKKTRFRPVIYGPDQPDSVLFQAFNHLQNGGTYNTWELAVPNGWYDIMLVCGDPDYGDFISTVNFEGITVVDPTPEKTFPNGGGSVFDTLNVIVNVTDGLLTLKPDTASTLGVLKADNVKFAFIQITQTVEPVSTGEVIKEKELLRYYPNPVTNGTVTIEHAYLGRATIKIYNILGGLIMETTTDQSLITLDIAGLEKGLYLITVNNKSTGKLIIK
jgi:hypothetical protein